MLQYSDLTIVKNANGLPSALGIPINSFLMKNEMFSGGGGGQKKEKKGKKEMKERKDMPLYDENLAVPMGLVCTTETVCRSAPAAQNVYDANANAAYANANLDESDIEIVPDSLYNNLLDLLNMPEPSKKMTRKGKRAAASPAGKKTRRNNKKYIKK
jgi:hypothetical protein